MKTTTGLLAILLSSCLIFACGGSKEKKGDDDKADKDDKDDTKSDEKKADENKAEGDTTASTGKKKLPGNFGALLAGGSKKRVNDTMKGTGMGLGSILGNMGGGMPGMAGSAPAKKAPEGEPVASPADHKMPKQPAAEPTPPAAPVAGASDADCDKVASHLMDMAMAQGGAEIPAEYRAQMEEMMAEAKAEVAKMCATQFSPEIKQCVLGAKSMDDMNKCEALFNQMGGGGNYGDDDDDYYGDDDDDYYDEPDSKPVGDPPKWDGKDSSCSATGAHMGKLLMWMYSGDAEAAAEMAPMLDEMVPQLVEMCDSGNWPEAARVCILKAQSEDDMEACGEMLGM